MEYTVRHSKGELTIEGSPDKCPFCHTGIKPTPVFGYNVNTNGLWVILMNCPVFFCQESFVAYYEPAARQQHQSLPINKPTYTGRTSVGKLKGEDFPNDISEISEGFVKIYNEAFIAEQSGLVEICGVGYRKALEFLIKDYAIKRHPGQQDKIEKKMLAACIKDYVTDEKIKSVAKRAVWLGNDETHFVRTWETKNLADLKKLISLTLHWIEAEILTESFENEMPD